MDQTSYNDEVKKLYNEIMSFLNSKERDPIILADALVGVYGVLMINSGVEIDAVELIDALLADQRKILNKHRQGN